MKKPTLIVTLVAAALVGGASAKTPTPTPSPAVSPGPALADAPSPAASPGPRCRNKIWSPEVYSFYGEKDAIVEKLASIPAKLSERRVFVQVTQGESSADVKLYVQQNDGTFTVTEWTTKPSSRLLAKIDEEIIANKGVECVGEQVKDVLAKELKKGKVSNAVAAPASPEAAFADLVKQASGEFIKSTLIILC
jgi:hypothetical protein